MVNITQCAVCGRTIPANGEACAYCERERPARDDRPYLPLAVRLLLMLFAVDLVATVTFAALSVGRDLAGDSTTLLPALLSLLRLCLGTLALLGLLVRRPWGWWISVAFVVAEVVGGVLALARAVPPSIWAGPLMAPLWTVLFGLILLRGDVRAHFDPVVADRREVDDLLRSVYKEDS